MCARAAAARCISFVQRSAARSSVGRALRYSRRTSTSSSVGRTAGRIAPLVSVSRAMLVRGSRMVRIRRTGRPGQRAGRMRRGLRQEVRSRGSWSRRASGRRSATTAVTRRRKTSSIARSAGRSSSIGSRSDIVGRARVRTGETSLVEARVKGQERYRWWKLELKDRSEHHE